MNRRQWRETVEIVGVVSIVASLLLVAWEIHRANRIAAAGLEIRLEQSFAELHGARASVPELARLFPKLASPEGHLTTATEASQIKGLVQHAVEVYRSAQIAHDHGLLPEARLAAYTSDLARMLDTYPGLAPYFIAMHEADPDMHKMKVFQPVRSLDANRATGIGKD